MAKKQLTIEEKLQAALVPAEEQPYKVPENWCWVRLDKLYRVNPKNENTDDDMRASFISMANIDGGMASNFTYEIQPWKQAKKGHTQMADGDVAFAKISPCFENRKSMIVEGLENGIGGGTTELIILRQPNVNKKYTFWLVSTEEFISKGRTTYSGTVGQQRISMDFVKNYPVPLAPLKEQSRIVARIESLFAKLDEAKEKIQEVLDGADLRRAAILHQAFTGKLTEKWRRENGVSDDSRETSNVKSICNSLKYGTAKKSVQDGDVAVLRMGNLQNGEIDWGSLVYSNDQDDIEKYSLKDGDVLFNRTNSAELVGKTSIYRGERPAIYAGYLIKLDYKRDKIIGDFFNYMLNSPKAKEYCNKVKTDGVNQSNINAKKIGAFEFDVPTILEQQEIVRLLDNLLSREQSTVTACEEALTTIDTLKKSILARAFRGELGTNDPSNPSAKELLREILSA
ncbi:restriction endonuclease subunit S [Selenomonas ruminantium]|uniref:restriction endonuclease subunit S n=1 Tax=Selenomonas ruminantium TaxID=971 RepID=UPI000410C358|nr:restriction endonuclease subunit S [Selenomonas ruminantium]